MARVDIDPGDDPRYPATMDRSAGKRWSVLGPLNGDGEYDPAGNYVLRDHEEAENIGRGSREEMIAEIERMPAKDDTLS